MFKNQYQMGKHVLLLSSSDIHKDSPNSKWSVEGTPLQLTVDR